MSSSPHKIRRQTWTVHAASKEDAFAIRQQLRDRFDDLFLPAFEKAFNQIYPAKLAHIPKIQLRVKLDSVEEITEILPERICEQLCEILLNHQLENPFGDTGTEAAAVKAGNGSRFDCAIHYLRTGTLSWAMAANTPGESAARLREACCKQWDDLAQFLMKEAPDVAVYFRLMQILSADENIALFRTVIPKTSQSWLPPFIELLGILLRADAMPFSRHVGWELAAHLITEAMIHQHDGASPNFTLVAERVMNRELGRWHSIVETFPEPVAALFGNAAASDETSPSAPVPANELMEEQRPAPVQSMPLTVPATMTGTNAVETPAERPPQPATFNVETSADFPLKVTHAGLILLHPFLPRYFQHAGVLEKNGSAIVPDQLPRAAALLHFLSAGNDDIYEYDLPLIKVLIGLTPDTALCVGSGLLTEADHEEANLLLQSVIEYWTALKRASLGGLRQSFLNRPGLLRELDHCWKLQIEQQPFDMLLGRLPWNFSLAKLPWTKKIIQTEWQIR